MEGVSGVTAYMPPAGDKLMRLHGQSAAFENGLVLLPKEAHWLSEYERELTTFPGSKHDDQVDSTTQGLDWMRRPFPGWGLYEYMRQEAEKLHRGTSKKTFRFKAPDDIRGCFQCGSTLTSIGPDGIVEIAAQDVELLSRNPRFKLIED